MKKKQTSNGEQKKYCKIENVLIQFNQKTKILQQKWVVKKPVSWDNRKSLWNHPIMCDVSISSSPKPIPTSNLVHQVIELPVNLMEHVIRTVIWANKWICQDSYVQPHSGYWQNDPPRSYQKKGCQEPGFPWVLPNRLSEIIQKVAQMTGITLLFYGCPAFEYIFVNDPWSP